MGEKMDREKKKMQKVIGKKPQKWMSKNLNKQDNVQKRTCK